MAQSMSGTVIRDAVSADAAAIIAFLGDLAAERLDVVPPRPLPAIADEEQAVAAADAAEHAALLIAVDGAAVVGCLDVWAGTRPHDRHAAHFGMSVAAPWRRRGIGTALLTTAIRRVRSWPGCCRLELDVVPWNTGAIRLYERAGFVHEGRKAKAVNFRGVPEDLLMMALVW